MTFFYNITKTPRRPECEIYISNLGSNENKQVNAIPDTGADMTMIPNTVITQMENLTEGEKIGCRGVNGELKEIQTYYVNIRIGDQDFPNHLVALCPKEYAIIGRDILNQSKASFYANQNTWRLNCGESCT